MLLAIWDVVPSVTFVPRADTYVNDMHRKAGELSRDRDQSNDRSTSERVLEPDVAVIIELTLRD